MKIFFDFDGTLIDSRERVYQLFQHMVAQSDFTFDDYWQLKRNKIGHQEILIERFSYTPDEYETFVKEWMNKIELPEWLQLDKPFNGVTEYLYELSKEHRLFIITARQFTDRIVNQVKSFGWNDLFHGIFVTNRTTEKSQLLKELLPENTDWIIGDTGHDIQTGKILGMKTAAVLSGFLNREKLMAYKPDLIINSVLDFTLD